MMNGIKSLFHFLGGVHLAIVLIATAMIMVIAGTFLESKTGSHLLAAYWTYESPFFLFLLILFFVNILFAALRRWPFKKRHIPFLITHLGLLMIISGTIVKNRWGLQGQLTVWEGSGNQHLLLPHSHALLVEERGELSPSKNMIALESFQPEIYYPFHLPQLKCKLIGYAPHVKEELETWIKGSQACIAGFPSIPVHEWHPGESFPEAASYAFALAHHYPTWSIIALRTAHVKEALQQAYLQQLVLKLSPKGADDLSFELPLRQALQHPFSLMQGTLTTNLELSALDKDVLPSLNLVWNSQHHSLAEKWTIALQGEDALIVKPALHPWVNAFFTVDLKRPHPLLCLIEDNQGNTFLFAFDTSGRFHKENFASNQLQTLMSYEQGFSGYGVQAVVPIPSFPTSREDKENGEEFALSLQLREALAQHPTLAPPLHFFEEACQNAQVDFPTTFVHFLRAWNAHPGFLFHPQQEIPEALNKAFNQLDWNAVSQQDRQAIQWTSKLLRQLEDSWQQGEDPVTVLERNHWPFIEELEQANPIQNSALLNSIAQQVFSLTNYLPPLDLPVIASHADHAHLLSAYFRIYGIDYRSLLPYRGNHAEQFENLENYWKEKSGNQNLQQTIVFETPLSHRVIPDEIPTKLEDQRPGIVLEVQEGTDKHMIALAYDPSNGGLKWPILNGKYLMRFQSHLKELPYRIRLRQARQISYPQSQQVYSYESDLLISEKEKPAVEHTLSMNKVYETWDGYRFYLAGIGSSTDDTLKRIQLAVNYDPAKYVLTYPGAFLVFLGTVLLFWMKRFFAN